MSREAARTSLVTRVALATSVLLIALGFLTHRQSKGNESFHQRRDISSDVHFKKTPIEQTLSHTRDALPQALSLKHNQSDSVPHSDLISSSYSDSTRRLLTNISHLNPDQWFLHCALRHIRESSDIVYFNGPRGKKLFDQQNVNPHVLLNDKQRIRHWGDLAAVINETHSKLSLDNAAVHLHNEMKIGDVLLILVEEYRRKHKIPPPKPQVPIPIERETLHAMMDFGQPPIVMTNTMDENWGFFSTFIANRTTKWLNMTNHLRIHYSNYKTLHDFISSDKILLIFCNSHVDPLIGAHEKILALPLGVRSRVHDFARAKIFATLSFNKSKLLTINNSGWGPRSSINKMVTDAFNGQVRNSYGNITKQGVFVDLRGVSTHMDHLLEIALSKFVLCPSGLGYDTYRMWETMLMGSIPVVESNRGFDRTYTSLPVLIVQSFEYLTPHLLEIAYPCFLKHIHDFKYEMLREDYWLTLLQTAIATGTTTHVMKHHPFRHKYCDFLDYRPPKHR